MCLKKMQVSLFEMVGTAHEAHFIPQGKTLDSRQPWFYPP